jgi:hypothetical protein
MVVAPDRSYLVTNRTMFMLVVVYSAVLSLGAAGKLGAVRPLTRACYLRSVVRREQTLCVMMITISPRLAWID